jgi:hypothetical protein
VLDEQYAVQIARDWNVKDAASGFAGYVTRFVVFQSAVERYPVRIAGASHHRELWIPAEDLELLNRAIIGQIEVIASFE